MSQCELLRGARSDGWEASPRKPRRRGSWPKRLLILLASVVALYVPWLVYLYFAQETLIFIGAYRDPAGAQVPVPAGAEQLWLEVADDVRVEAWYEPGAGRAVRDPGPAVIFLHGNLVVMHERWCVSRPYVAAGFSYLAPDYRGYARSGGEPSQEALIADGVRFYDWLSARPEVDPDRIILHGVSLGGAVAIAVADRRPAAALILESTFSSMARVGRRFGAPDALCRHPFRSDRVIDELQIPILLVHGRDDWLVSVDHSRRLHALAPHARLIEADIGHLDYEPYWEAIGPFLGEHGFPEMATARAASP